MAKPSDQDFDFWNDHSLEFLEMAMKRDFQERVVSCDAMGTARRDCGDTISFFLMADQGRLGAISYDIQGCIFTHACANTIIELAAGKPICQAAAISEADIIAYLKTLPEKEEHCAGLALKAFLIALEQLPAA